jgi:hypothetical protein
LCLTRSRWIDMVQRDRIRSSQNSHAAVDVNCGNSSNIRVLLARRFSLSDISGACYKLPAATDVDEAGRSDHDTKCGRHEEVRARYDMHIEHTALTNKVAGRSQQRRERCQPHADSGWARSIMKGRQWPASSRVAALLRTTEAFIEWNSAMIQASRRQSACIGSLLASTALWWPAIQPPTPARYRRLLIPTLVRSLRKSWQ